MRSYSRSAGRDSLDDNSSIWYGSNQHGADFDAPTMVAVDLDNSLRN